MADESARVALDDAWSHIPHSREAVEGLGTFTRTRMERIITLVVGFGCLALGAQAFFAAVGSSSGDSAVWHVVLMSVTFVPLAAMLLACGLGRGVALFAGTFAVAYAGVLMVWPIATTGSHLPADQEPWIFYLVSVATVSTVLAFPIALQIAWTALLPPLFGVVRLIQGNFAPGLWIGVSLDVSFSLVLGGVLVALVWTFRSVAAGVDDARARAVSTYAAAAAADAAEQERVAVAGLMHDSVLAALIAAARADTVRERQLAVAMAREALTRLANSDSSDEEGSDEPVTVGGIASELQRVARDLGVVLVVNRDAADGAPAVRGRVARALVLAAAQAVANSVQHADAKGLQAVVARTGEAGLSVVVRDRGPGFDLDTVAPDRLGIRGSIIARLAAVGGHADIASGAGGTTVTLTWGGA